MTLRDTLLRAAAAGFFQLYWSAEILDETVRNLVAKARVSEEQAARLLGQMTKFFPEAMVVGYEPLIESMPNDEKDRHVAAAAVKAGAQVIVTSNLKDFRELPDGIEAKSPDDFLLDLFDLDPDAFVELVRQQSQALRNPPVGFVELLAGLATTVPGFAQSVAGQAGVDLHSDLPPTK